MADIFQIVENNGTPKDIGDSKARANIAPTFDVSKANAVGDLVLSDTGILYRFNAAYTAGTSWNSRSSKEIVNLAEVKAPLDSPAFTGIPTAPTAAAGTNNTQIATTAYTDNAIAPIKSDIGIVENTNTAMHTISAGQYVIWKGNLYTANAAISSGTALTTSNLTAVNNGGLNAIDAKIHDNIPKTMYRPLTENQTSDWSYTVSHTGTLYLCFISTVRTYIGIKWNNHTIMNVALASSNPGQANTVTLRVKKGDVIGVLNLTTDCWLSATVTSLIADAYEPVQ